MSDTEWYYVTKLRDGYHDRWIYEEPPDCDLLVSYQYDLGAEDAIAATLGDADATGERHGVAGTCHITDNGPWGYPYVCSACGASFDPDVNNGELNHCPNCGARVVEPTTNDVGAEVDV